VLEIKIRDITDPLPSLEMPELKISSPPKPVEVEP